MSSGSDATQTRRAFMKAAVAAGGASALSACLGFAEGGNREPIPDGVEDLSTLPDRQHAWRDRIRLDQYGNALLPRHQILLYLNLDRGGALTEEALSAFQAIRHEQEFSIDVQRVVDLEQWETEHPADAMGLTPAQHEALATAAAEG